MQAEERKQEEGGQAMFLSNGSLKKSGRTTQNRWLSNHFLPQKTSTELDKQQRGKKNTGLHNQP